MPAVHTRRFGDLEYDESSVLTFPCGLPGFESHTRFTVIEQPPLAPIVFLQSLDAPELCFLAAPVATIDASYALSITHDDLERLGLDGSRQPDPVHEVLCLALLCVPENGPLTANLLAPIVIHLRSRIAVQAVRTDTRYSHLHPIHAEATCW